MQVFAAQIGNTLKPYLALLIGICCLDKDVAKLADSVRPSPNGQCFRRHSRPGFTKRSPRFPEPWLRNYFARSWNISPNPSILLLVIYKRCLSGDDICCFSIDHFDHFFAPTGQHLFDRFGRPSILCRHRFLEPAQVIGNQMSVETGGTLDQYDSGGVGLFGHGMA